MEKVKRRRNEISPILCSLHCVVNCSPWHFQKSVIIVILRIITLMIENDGNSKLGFNEGGVFFKKNLRKNIERIMRKDQRVEKDGNERCNNVSIRFWEGILRDWEPWNRWLKDWPYVWWRGKKMWGK